MATGMRAAPTSPIGHPDILWGLPGQGGLLTEWAETVPDLTWPESIRTYGRMRRDPRITAILQAYTLPILRATWAVDPAGVDRAEAVDLVAANLGLPVLGEKGEAKASPVRGFTWHDHLRLALLSLVYGHMPFEQWYEQRGGRTQLAGLQERQPHTVNIIDIDQQGYVSQVWQNTQDKPIPANRLVWYAREREGANYTGVSLLRACYTPWVLKHESMRVHATSIRRFGMGIPVVKAPPGATPSQVTEAQRLAAGMRAGDQAGAGLPSGFDFNLAGMSGSAPDAIGFLNYCDQQMTGSALAQVVELASSTYGSRAVGATFLDLFLLALQAVADQIGATISQGDPAMPGVARSLVEYNWGEGEPVPRVVAADVGDRHELTAEAVQALVASGSVHPDEDLEAFIRDAWSLPPRNPATQFPPPPPKSGPGRPPPAGPGEPGGGGGPPPAAPAPAAPGGPAPAPGGGNMFGPVAAAGPGGLRRHLTPVEAASGLDPVAIRDDIDSAARRVLAAWAPVVAAQRNELADQVTAAVDDGQLARLAQLTAPAGDGPGLLHRAMSAVAQRAAARAIGEAAAQGVDIDPAAVTVDEDRLRQLAAARAAMAGQALAQAASRKALQVVTASAGTQAARHVTAELAGLSTTPLADQLLAAMGAASNEGRFAVMDAGPEAAYTATEIMDANTCDRCAEVDGHVFASLADARAAYPAGAYHECLGALRCRGTVVASWPDVAPPGRPPFGEAQAAFDPGERRDDHGQWTRGEPLHGWIGTRHIGDEGVGLSSEDAARYAQALAANKPLGRDKMASSIRGGITEWTRGGKDEGNLDPYGLARFKLAVHHAPPGAPVLHRGLAAHGDYEPGKARLIDQIGAASPGDVITTDRAASWSAKQAVAREFAAGYYRPGPGREPGSAGLPSGYHAVMIQSQPGARAVAIARNALPEYRYQAEWVTPPSRYRVVANEPHPDVPGLRVVTVTEEPPP
jgi:hypothetical protein